MIMNTVRGLTAPEFTRVLGSPRFQERVRALARYTLDTVSEGGLAVYKNIRTGRLAISQADLPDDEEREQERQRVNSIVRIEDHIDSSTARTSYMYERLTGIKRPGFDCYAPRKDVALLIHSHPTYSEEKASDFLRPSLTDLEAHDELLGYNPRLIDGILVAEEDLARILFYRSSEQRVNAFYQTLEIQPPATKTVELMRESGYHTAIAEFNLVAGSIRTIPSRCTDELFRNA